MSSTTVKWPATTIAANPVFTENWLVPDAMSSLAGVLDESTGLRFLQFARRSRCHFGNSFDPLGSLVKVPSRTSLEMLLDDQERPYCLWLRTPEPLDWRRVTAQIEVITSPTPHPDAVVTLKMAVLPSPDATSAFLLAVADGGAVRLAKGDMRLTLDYLERVPNATSLPVLQRIAGASKVSAETWKGTFQQPSGSAWAIS